MLAGLLVALYFYPRSPCGERPIGPQVVADSIRISIHALLAESDAPQDRTMGSRQISIHALLAESDRHMTVGVNLNNISIHALLAESDCSGADLSATLDNFYPRSPCGERHFVSDNICRAKIFLSTLSLRRATDLILPGSSIPKNFYPRSPCGERPDSAR